MCRNGCNFIQTSRPSLPEAIATKIVQNQTDKRFEKTMKVKKPWTRFIQTGPDNR